MKAWDTNFLIRHLVEDDDAQVRIARGELAKAQRSGSRIWISSVVMVEAAWVLKAYGLRKAQVMAALEAVCQDERFQVEGGGDMVEALIRARRKGDLPEHVAALAAKGAGRRKTQTFDHAVREFPEFEVF